MPIVLVTHDLGEALMLADTLSLLHRGQTLQHGPPAEVLRRPVSALAARLLGHRNIFGATVVESLSPEGFTIIEWGGRPLEAAPAEGVARGDRVTWTVPASKVVLHRRDRPSRGTRENAVSGILSEHLLLGDMTASTLRVDGAGNVNLSFQVPTHVAERNRLATGERVSVSLLAEAIHLMPPDD